MHERRKAVDRDRDLCHVRGVLRGVAGIPFPGSCILKRRSCIDRHLMLSSSARAQGKPRLGFKD